MDDLTHSSAFFRASESLLFASMIVQGLDDLMIAHPFKPTPDEIVSGIDRALEALSIARASALELRSYEKTSN